MKSERKRAKDRAWQWFSKYVRLRDCISTTLGTEYGKCISCGALVRIEEADAGHFIPGRKDAYLFVETNVHLQCKRCNRYLGGNWVPYERAIISLYGKEECERLKGLKFEPHKFTIAEYREIADTYRKKCNELKEDYL